MVPTGGQWEYKKIMSTEVRPTIQRIDITDHQLEILKKTLNSSKLSPSSKERIQKESGFGMCVVCGGIATQKACYDCAGATRIERYCDLCVEKQFSRTQKGQIDGGKEYCK